MNNNKSARIYRIAISAIDSPGSSELRTRPVDGELLFAPASWRCRLVRASILNFTIMVHGITASATTGSHFARSPPRNLTKRSPTGGEVSTEPVVVMDTILVVRPRQVQFKWSFDQVTGTVSNTGNTWFKLLIKPVDVIRPKRKAMPGIYVRETWFISLSYVSRGIIIWSITTNSLRLAIPVRLSPPSAD